MSNMQSPSASFFLSRFCFRSPRQTKGNRSSRETTTVAVRNVKLLLRRRRSSLCIPSKWAHQLFCCRVFGRAPWIPWLFRRSSGAECSSLVRLELWASSVRLRSNRRLVDIHERAWICSAHDWLLNSLLRIPFTQENSESSHSSSTS